MGKVRSPNARGITFLARVETNFLTEEGFLCYSVRRLFHFWTNDWSTRGSLNEAFPHLFALSMNLGAIVAECWDGTLNPTLAGSLSDQRVEEFFTM